MMDWLLSPRPLHWLLIAAALAFALSSLAFWAWGQFSRRARGGPSAALPPQSGATALDHLIEPLLANHPETDSAAALIEANEHAFRLRADTARAAGRSLDVQYYIWHDDVTGRLLKHELMAAAERGVRVRMLIDDINLTRRDDALRAMDRHPNLEIRLFNPARNRDTSWRRALEMALRFFTVNRRMHNKAWIADGRIALVGGRNIGDEYFDAAEALNFLDADLLLIGDAVAQTSVQFDEFWNSKEVIPLASLHPRRDKRWSQETLRRVRAAWCADLRATGWLDALPDHSLAESLTRGITWHWTSSLRVLSDPPAKAAPLEIERAPEHWLMFDVLKLLFSAERSTFIISPYFVPTGTGTLALSGQSARGVEVHVLTNSLSATDVAMVHAGYMDYRKPLLSTGVTLHELKRGCHRQNLDLIGSRGGASLHTKAFVVDGERGFVGSFNFDPRSAQLNTEMGVVFNHAPLAEAVTAMFATATRPERSYRVALENGALIWHDVDANGPRTWTHEPETRWHVRALVSALSRLPIESQL